MSYRRTFWKGQDPRKDNIKVYMADDMCQFIKNCITCRSVNDAIFIKVGAALHPIPVKSQVWNQVHCMCTNAHVLIYSA